MPIQQARLKISDYRDRRKKRLKSGEKKIQIVSLSLTSMVDMFAILVIFLLVNTDTVSQWIDVSAGIQLPKASRVESPSEGSTIEISLSEIKVEGKSVEDLKGTLDKIDKGRLINIVAHEALAFEKVRKVLGVCQSLGFEKISLAVQPTI